jgi:hypothetical protein
MQSAGNGMMSECGLDDLQDAFDAAKAAMAPPPDNPAIREARREFSQAVHEFNSCCIQIKNSQGWLRRAVTDWRHVLLGDIGADAFSVPQQIDYDTEFRSVAEARQATKDFLPRLQWAKGVCAEIVAAQSFDNRRDEQDRELIRALAARRLQSDERIIALEGQVSALTARLDRLDRKRKKSKHSRPTATRSSQQTGVRQ